MGQYQDQNLKSLEYQKRVKYEQKNLVSKSLSNFNPEMKYQTNQNTFQSYPSFQMNQSFTGGGYGESQYFTSSHQPNQHFGLNHSQNVKVNHSNFGNISTQLNPRRKKRQVVQSLEESHRRGIREFIPSHRQKEREMNVRGMRQVENQRKPEENNTQWGLKIDKINPSLEKLGKHNFLKDRSSEIHINGVNSNEMSTKLHEELLKIGEISELKMKWLNNGDMQVKFKYPESARKAMELLDGRKIGDTTLKVTQVFQIIPSFKPKIGKIFRKTRLPKIQESGNSSDGEKVSSSENDIASPQQNIESDQENHELIEK